jgi:Viral BACON domain
VTINGSGFTGATGVSFGLASVPCGVDNTCTVDRDTQITVVSPAENASDASASVPVDVTVTTPNGTSTKSSADQFTYTASPQPPVMQLSANSLTFGPLGCNSSQSQQITITNGGGGTLTWTVDTSSQPSWLTVTPTNGSAPGTLKFTATTGLSNTSSHTTVNITGSDGTTQTVTVTLTVQCIG